MANNELGSPIGLPPGLGNLPLHVDKDGWYSVLGSWNGTADNPNPANEISEANPENNLQISISALDPAREARPGLLRIFCQYHKCSGNRLAPHLLCTITSPTYCITNTYLLLLQWSAYLRSG